MNKRDKKRLYRQAINNFGLSAQMNMLMEECAELIQATNKVLRDDSDINYACLASEMADVIIMIEQLRYFIDWMDLDSRVEQQMGHKLERLNNLLNGRKVVYRGDGRVEILCEHGIGHTTYDSAVLVADKYKEWERSDNPDITRESVISAWLSHGCDGCCKDFKECKKGD